jgi:hypothetical protein
MEEQVLTIQLQVDHDDYELVIGEKVGRVTDPLLQVKVLTPTEEPQTAVPDEGYEGLISVSVLAIPSNYVGSAIPRRDGNSLVVSGPGVTVPAGYYAGQQQATVHVEQLQQPSIAINKTTGVVTVSMHQPAGYVADSYQSSEQVLDIQSARTITPTESVQTAVEQYRWTIGEVKVGAIPSTYVGSAIPRRDGNSLIVSGLTVTVPAGYYSAQQQASVPTQPLSEPSITINNATGLITVTETQDAGWVEAGTKSATKQLDTQVGKTITPIQAEQTAVAAYRWTTGAVKVAAIPSQYIVPSGTLTITEEGTFDVTHYASALVDMGVIPITKGGTGATTAAGALSNLGAVAKAGDTMTGNLTLQKKLILTSGTAASYGSTLPSSGSTGEVFFKLS